MEHFYVSDCIVYNEPLISQRNEQICIFKHCTIAAHGYMAFAARMLKNVPYAPAHSSGCILPFSVDTFKLSQVNVKQ